MLCRQLMSGQKSPRALQPFGPFSCVHSEEEGAVQDEQ